MLQVTRRAAGLCALRKIRRPEPCDVEQRRGFVRLFGTYHCSDWQQQQQFQHAVHQLRLLLLVALLFTQKT